MRWTRQDARVQLRIFAIPPWALLTDHRPYGDGLVAFGFLRELAARGHELHVAAHRVDLRDPVPPNLHLHRLGEGDEPGPLDRVKLMVRLRRLHAALERERPFDVVHQLNPVEAGVTLGLPRSTCPLVLGPYVPDWDRDAQVPGAIVNPAALLTKRVVRAAQQRRATAALVSTAAALAVIEPSARRRLTIEELPPGIDAGAWREGPEGGGGNGILFLANLSFRKGIHDLLDAFALTARQLPDARLVVAGDGPELEAVRGRVRTTQALAKVQLLGRVDTAGAVAALHACDLFCAPSRAEPFGMAALEAMACGRAVVATDAGGLRHLVSDEGGRKVRPGDVNQLAAVLTELLTDTETRRAMGRHNRAAVERSFAWPRVVDRLEVLYERAIASTVHTP